MPRPFDFKILLADASHVGEELRKQSVALDAVFTSPPYLGQRQYGNSPAEVGRGGSAGKYAERLARILTSLPLRERASIWVNLDDVRGDDGRLLRLPQRLEAAMETRGWFVAERVAWVKALVGPDGRGVGSCMPESIRRWRCNDNAFEFVTRFTRSTSAWSDLCAVGVPRVSRKTEEIRRYLPESLMRATTDTEGRQRLNVWRINVSKSRAAHYATMPIELAEIAIASSCPQQVCRVCGHARERIYDLERVPDEPIQERGPGKYVGADVRAAAAVAFRKGTKNVYIPRMPVTTDWIDCGHDDYAGGVVCDPFAGSGTTGVAALQMGRSFLGVELYEKYASIAYRRCRETLDMLDRENLDPWRLAA
jgi:site-specific DNA-methyltransferase (adenine-specific)